MSTKILLSALALVLAAPLAVTAQETATENAMDNMNMEMKAGDMMGQAEQISDDTMAEGQDMMDDTMAETVEVGNKVCPIEGNAIKEEEAFKMEHNGKIYNLCSAPCVQKFAADPEKYIANLPKEESATEVNTMDEMKEEMGNAAESAADLMGMPEEKEAK